LHWRDVHSSLMQRGECKFANGEHLAHAFFLVLEPNNWLNIWILFWVSIWTVTDVQLEPSNHIPGAAYAYVCRPSMPLPRFKLDWKGNPIPKFLGITTN